MRLIDVDGSYTINATDNTSYSLAFGGGIISCADEFGHIVAEFFADDIPTIDAVPVLHGRWDDSGKYTFQSGDTAVRCTNCGCALTESEYHLNNWNYCPVCGAKMDGADG